MIAAKGDHAIDETVLYGHFKAIKLHTLWFSSCIRNKKVWPETPTLLSPTNVSSEPICSSAGSSPSNIKERDEFTVHRNYHRESYRSIRATNTTRVQRLTTKFMKKVQTSCCICPSYKSFPCNKVYSLYLFFLIKHLIEIYYLLSMTNDTIDDDERFIRRL